MATRKKPDVIIEDDTVYVLRPGQKVFLKTADVSAMTGKSNQWIGQLTSQGIICKKGTPHGSLFELSDTMKSYCEMLENRADARGDEDALKRDKEKSEAEVGIKKAKAIISLLEAQELQGKMHRSDDVAAMTSDLIYAMRGALLALPGRLAVDMAATETSAEAAELIRKEVHKVMKELASYRYDPEQYKERVRERRNWESEGGRDDDGS